MIALVVFLNGMAIMVMEMVGARLLAPWLGTSIVVWTSLIGVILASLSLGYWLGGCLADRSLQEAALPPEAPGDAPESAAETSGKNNQRANDARHSDLRQDRYRRARRILGQLLLAAALCVLLAAIVQAPVLELLSRSGVSLYLAAVAAAVMLFCAPAVLCGMVSPYAMRLAITRSETAGGVIGRLNAIGTVGSIFGTFLGGFVLISWFGSMEIMMGVAATLLAAGILAQARPLLPRALLASAILLSAAGAHSWAAYKEKQGDVTLESPYSTIQVNTGEMDGKLMRLLITNPGSCQSGAYLDDHTALAFHYTRFYALGPYLRPDARRILMLGGGGYSVPKWLLAGKSALASQDFTLDVVELDPAMTFAAQEYFWAPKNDPRLRILHEDARIFINNAAARLKNRERDGYDLIFADIFNSWYTVPFHVGTVEAARRIHTLLKDDGVYIMNIITALDGDNGRLLHGIRNAFAQVFPKVYVLPVHYTANDKAVQNVMLLAFRGERGLPDPAREPLSAPIAQLLSHVRSRPFQAGDVPPLTDNFAPVERYVSGYHN